MGINGSQLQHERDMRCERRRIWTTAKTAVIIEENDGAQRRIRTTDTRIFSPLLYQLSYLGLFRQTKSRAPDFIESATGAP